jgi:hypothetical protein
MDCGLDMSVGPFVMIAVSHRPGAIGLAPAAR